MELGISNESLCEVDPRCRTSSRAGTPLVR